ncbi:chromatin modification-related protein Yng2p [[Candida] anglica]|uniref:Chromatin modification-related protein n=1 Tax=[Candida] anglica TaxID=148631 RepID=A0ABP0ED48_9ASCO
MDTTTVLDKYTQDLSNLPLEVKHLLQEIKIKDTQLQERRKKCQTKDSQIHKFIRANGTLTKHPKEQQMYARIEEDMVAIKKLQKEKILLANTALFLISKHLCNFETDVSKLEREGMLPVVENVLDVDNASDSASGAAGASDGVSGTSTPKPSDSSTANVKRLQKRKQAGSIRVSSSMTPNSSRPPKRQRSEDAEDSTPGEGTPVNHREHMHGAGGSTGAGAGAGAGDDADNNLYCFCQRVSFGEMIGCDNDDCKYEWFHWACVGITSPPKDDDIWYCPDCSPKMEKRKKKRK